MVQVEAEGGALTLPVPYLCQLVLSISNRLTGKQILSNRKTHFNTKGSERLRIHSPFAETLPLGSPPPILLDSPQFSLYPVLTEKDLPAKLEVLTTSVTLIFRHVWSISGAAVGGQWVGPESGKNEMVGEGL